MSSIRSFRVGDEAALAEVCVRTALSGADATGRYSDDAIWAEIYVLPYLARHPDFAFVVETDDGRVAGYIVGTPDTRAFENWFRAQWWPQRAARWPHPPAGSPEAETLDYAADRGEATEPYGDDYPAHLHIDLLPEVQGAGWGRRLIETFVEAVRAAGVSGVHLVASADNAGALAFYPHVGFAPLPSPAGVQAFARTL